MTARRRAISGAASLLRREMRAVREPFRLLWSVRSLARAADGRERVVVFPGYGTSDFVTKPLRAYLASRGHETLGWGLGRNRGNVPGNIGRVIEQVDEIVREGDGRAVVLVGWSLGGVFAREVARHRPELVCDVVTMATPVFGVPREASLSSGYTAAEVERIEERYESAARVGLVQRVTAFYSRLDSVVHWERCIDVASPRADHIEVRSSHLGITLDPDVWVGIAHRLGENGRAS